MKPGSKHKAHGPHGPNPGNPEPGNPELSKSAHTVSTYTRDILNISSYISLIVRDMPLKPLPKESAYPLFI